jgi:dTDP-4-amino-4,6-dideoxygalactose transaminase
MQAAIGLLQLDKLQAWITTRTRNANTLVSSLTPYPSVHIAAVPGNHVHAYYRLSFRVDPSRLKRGWDRDLIQRALSAEGIPCLSGARPEIYLEEVYTKSTPLLRRLPNAACLATTSLALLVHPTIDEKFLNDCHTAIEKVFDAATD